MSSRPRRAAAVADARPHRPDGLDRAGLRFAAAGDGRYDPLDPASANRSVANFTADLDKGAKGLRIGVIRHFHEVDNKVSPATQKGIDDALAIFQAQGAEVRDVTVSSMMDYNAPGWVMLTAEAYAVHEPWLKERFNDSASCCATAWPSVPCCAPPTYVQAARRRRVLCEEMRDAMANLDILITASAPAEAPKITEVPKWGMFEKPNFTMPFNLTGLPALSRLLRLRRRRPAGQHPDRRQAVRRGDRVPRRPRLRNGNRLAQQATSDVGRACGLNRRDRDDRKHVRGPRQGIRPASPTR